MRKALLMLMLVIVVAALLYYYWPRKQESLTEEECLAKGAEVVSISDQAGGGLTGEVIGNIAYRQDGALCVKQ